MADCTNWNTHQVDIAHNGREGSAQLVAFTLQLDHLFERPGAHQNLGYAKRVT
jgi:hypothetical protein